jgi:hypothetical protein
LEFPGVFVIGLVEGLMPSGKGNLEEERRICFVAISRAMHLLFLSYPLNYLGQPAKKSIFLDEILGKRQPCHPQIRRLNRLTTATETVLRQSISNHTSRSTYYIRRALLCSKSCISGVPKKY